MHQFAILDLDATLTHLTSKESKIGEALPAHGAEPMESNWPGNTPADRTPCLVCIHPAERIGQLYQFGRGEFLIGRDATCNLEISDSSVSRRHALVRPAAEGFELVDLDSKNGTFLNDVRIHAHPIEPGDRLRFGSHIYKYLSADRFDSEYLENSYRMMTTDGLTQIYNRRYLFDVIERELSRMRRTNHPLSVLMMDVDHFKAINDTFGHLAGDEALIEVVRRVRSSLRGHEVLARFGGEEFCLLLPETTLGEALEVAERARAVVAESPFTLERVEAPVTISIGAACTVADETLSVTELIDRADKQLFAAKRAGRNRVAG